MKAAFKTLACIAAGFGLCACAGEKIENPPVGGVLGDADTYVSLRIAMPGGPGLKADPETGDGEVVGTAEENAFNEVSLYFFAKASDTPDRAVGPCLGSLTLQGNVFEKKTEGENRIVYYQSNPQKVGLEGSYYVYAVVNGKVQGVVAGTDIDTFIKAVFSSSDAISSGDQGLVSLVMTSRSPGDVTISSNSGALGSSENTPAVLALDVERVSAKVSYKANKENNEYPIVKDQVTGQDNVKAKLTEYKLVNLRNNAYSFRKTGESLDNALAQPHYGGADLTAGKYVIDPAFAEKTEANSKTGAYETFFGNNYLANPSAYKALPTTADGNYTLMGYCMENTMPKESQLNGFTTGVIFKALYTPNTVYKISSDKSKWETVEFATLAPAQGDAEKFYFFNNQIYYALIGDLHKSFGLADDYQIPAFEYEDAGKALICYYKYWIQHIDNGIAGDLGAMEYAIVRNNAYQLDVNSIKGIGDPTEVIDPENPDEDKELWLQVRVSILPWVVRNNSIDL